MHTTEHTDPDGDALTVHRDKGLAWVTITRDSDELTVGPVPAHALTGQHRGSHTRNEKRNAEARPLTPDAITDAMVERAAERYRGLPTAMRATDRARVMLRAALTEPPARPEGAEEIEAILADLPDTMLPATDAGRADLLASRGVRAPEGGAA